VNVDTQVVSVVRDLRHLQPFAAKDQINSFPDNVDEGVLIEDLDFNLMFQISSDGAAIEAGLADR
jgi:hypothetical protein